MGSRGEPDARLTGTSGWAGTGKPTPETVHGVPSPTRHEILERGEANLIFQVISKRYEKGSIILASNKSFGKAHMFA
ncbi:hypothetical protein FE391_08480 [Nonomuraea sp. KC401]|nr:ATP-binding protein [Nonomuraea sp. K271]TLF80223.1 hypothetical protein FE391_08480 [Nonomuraea sp. KC401]